MSQQRQVEGEVARRRLCNIAAAVVPANQLSPAPCVSIAELEGEAIGRLASVKVALLGTGDRGVPLASRDMVEKLFKQRSLDPVWVNSVEGLPADTTILVSTGAPVDSALLTKVPKLQLVAVAFTGTDHIDLAACQAKGILVTNVPDYSTDATAELAVGLILSHLRQLPQCIRNIQEGKWACPPQDDLQSKTVGILGVGRIGVRLAQLFKAFKVKGLLGFSLTQDQEFLALGGSYVDSLAGLFLDADIICVCTPLTTKTKGMVSDQLMELLQPDNLLVNVSRGGVVDEVALAKFLRAKRFSAALDVFSSEPLPQNSPLRGLPQEVLMMTPHTGYQSLSSLDKRLEKTVKNILAFLAGDAINTVS